MGENDERSRKDEQRRKVAHDRMRDLPAETAGGRIDPESLPEDQRGELATRVPRAEDNEDR